MQIVEESEVAKRPPQLEAAGEPKSGESVSRQPSGASEPIRWLVLAMQT